MRRAPFLLLAVFLSGTAALVYQVVWVRQLGEMLGAGAYAVNTVLAVFFAGMGGGAWLFGRAADRGEGSIRLVVGLELAIAASGLLFAPAAALFEALYDGLAPAEWELRRALPLKMAVAGALLLVPTAAMGGTIPALVRHLVRRRSELGSRLGLAYGWNTLGAAAGAALAVGWLLPRFGVHGATWLAAGANVAAAALFAAARLPGSRAEPVPEPGPGADPPDVPTAVGVRVDGTLRAAALVSGFVSVGLEVLWTRALATRFLSTVYSFATIVFVFLLCLGAGSLAVGRLDRAGALRRSSAAIALVAAGLLAILSVLLLARIPARGIGSASFFSFQLGELLVALLVMAGPCLLFGANLPLLCALAHKSRRRLGGELGGMLLANTLGSVAAPLLVGFLLLPLLGLRNVILVLGVGSVLFSLAVLVPTSEVSSRGKLLLVWVPSAALVPLLVLAAGSDVRLWSDAPGDRLLAYRDGAAASVAVVENRSGERVLKVNKSYWLGSSRTAFSQKRQGLVPALLGAEPRSALLIGMGTGGSAGAVASLGGVAVDVLEIVPGLGSFLPFFDEANDRLHARIGSDPAVRLLEVDGRHFVRTSERRYDLVVGDLFVPWRAGEGAMYTREHLDAVRGVLARGGAFMQWLPLYQLDVDDTRTIVATFCASYPEVEAFWLYLNVEQPALGLLGRETPLRLDVGRLRERLADPGRQRALREAGLTDLEPLLGSWIAGREALAAWSRGAPVETRARPQIEFSAPLRHVRSRANPARANLDALLDLALPADEAAFLAAAPEETRRDARRYQEAIAGFFRGSMALAFEADPQRALSELGRALEETPEWSWIAWNVERILLQALHDGDLGLALAGAEHLKRSERYAHLGHHHAAVAQRGSGDQERALAELERALELHPGYGPSVELRAELRAEPRGE